MVKTSTVPLRDVPSTETVNGQAHRPSVIVVDDEGNIANTLAEILSHNRYSAIAVYDAETALQTALLKPPEILITDVMLPGMNGIDLAIKIRRIYPDCRIFLFSGQTATTDLLAAANHDGHEFVLLSKPVHPTDLLALLSESRKPAQTSGLRRELTTD